eukprot:TRINITY_DN4295_c0_g1_i3.p1 TRINITY_DN4295_c0_g1~~TRINITY_DN4295_c0_g1_i3.p1  ORF type:complete len:362 (+),score=108.54 TRINITY_DN4295_c0_g1_i3:368-1453(+)
MDRFSMKNKFIEVNLYPSFPKRIPMLPNTHPVEHHSHTTAAEPQRAEVQVKAEEKASKTPISTTTVPNTALPTLAAAKSSAVSPSSQPDPSRSTTVGPVPTPSLTQTNELERLKKELMQQKADFQNLLQKTQSYEATIKKQQQEYEQLKSSKTVSAAPGDQRQLIEKLQKDLSQMKTDYEKQIQKNTAQEAAAKQQQQEIEKLKSNITSQRASSQQANSDKALAEQIKAELEKLKTTAAQQKTAFEKTIKQQQEEIEKLKTSAKSPQQDQQQASQLQQKLQTLEKQLKQKDEDIARAKSFEIKANQLEGTIKRQQEELDRVNKLYKLHRRNCLHSISMDKTNPHQQLLPLLRPSLMSQFQR